MKLNKKMIAVAAAGVLTAAAVPAMAFENEFHGMFLVQGITSNLLNGTTGPVAVDQSKLHANKTYIDQRARIMYAAKASDDLKLVTHFEIDSRWGDSSYTVNRNTGGSIGADQINLETKNVYLDFNVPGAPVNAKVGIQGWSDAYKGVFFGNDAAGVVTTTKVGEGKYSAGWFRFDDSRRRKTADGGTAAEAAGQELGKQTRDFLFLDAAYNVSKDVKVGASYYYYNDDFSILSGGTPFYAGGPTNAAIHMLGLNGSAKAGDVTVDGFVLYQNGVGTTFPVHPTTAGKRAHFNAFAANASVKAKAGIGTAKASILYTTGGPSNTFVSAQNETSAAWMESGIFSDANTVLIFRGNAYRTSTTDESIVSDAGNLGRGLTALFIGYDGAMGKTFFNVNAAAAADSKKTTAKAQYIGTEFNAEVGYKVYDNLKASVQGAYAVLGPRFSNSDVTGKYANNPYLGRVILSYNF
jgi:hypothetical protein